MERLQKIAITRKTIYLGVIFLLLPTCLLPLSSQVRDETVSAAKLDTQSKPDQSPNIVEGANDPDAIPDYIAYSIMFRIISSSQQLGKKRTRAYIRHLGLGDKECPTCSSQIGQKDQDVDTLIEAADEYNRQVSILDQQAREIKERTWHNRTPEARAALSQLQRQKQELVGKTVASLSVRLRPEALEKLHQYINEGVKRKIKLLPNSAKISRESR
jgi:hypothetical protein